MKITFVKPPSGTGLAGDAKVPEFGSKGCPSRSRLETYSFEVKESDLQTAEDGRRYFENPITGQRRYVGDRNDHVTFSPIKNP